MSNLLDSLSGGVYLFIFALVLLVAIHIYNEIAASGLPDPLGILPRGQGFYDALNNVSVFIFLGMSLAAILSALLIRAHPAFFFISVALVFIEFLIFPTLVNAYNDVARTSDFSTDIQELNLIVTLMQNLPIFTALSAFIAAVIGIGREI